MNLEDIDTSTWEKLETATRTPNASFRFLNLCSVDGEGKPQARTVVLRRVDRVTRVFEFHTDVRSPKWLEISVNPQVTALGYCGETRLQLRLQGIAELHGSESAVAITAWNRLPAHTRRTYAGGPPGDEQPVDPVAEQALLISTNEAEGKAHFGVIILRVSVLDWYQLQRENNRRARLTYNDKGITTSHRWINP
ncbi:pyridoxamine 5'-phosphate oxidase [Rouxiella sp. S1S-2]|nr:pyridoxamine 5'-phosphate oxidase [Rouxiella sp. S1S-2]